MRECTNGLMRRLSAEQATLVSARARALGDPTRVRILDVLSRAEQPVGRIAALLRCEPSTVSKHLQLLFHAGLVARRRDGSTVIYSMVDDGLIEWFHHLAQRRSGVRARRA